jgi:hypothetical protein
LLLVARLVGHPHGVVKAFPQFEALGFSERSVALEEGAEGRDGAVAGRAVWEEDLDGCRLWSLGNGVLTAGGKLLDEGT